MLIEQPGHSVALPLTRIQRERFKASLLAAHSGALLISTQRDAVREILRTIGASRLTPEQCVVGFKSFINEAATDIAIPLGRERTGLVDRFVSLFIEEMYAGDEPRTTVDVGSRGGSGGVATPPENYESPAAHR
ncbi:MAG TPA: hypothetical protein VGG76_00515 [Gemmatimonadaceae bacterium]|jgi:hypothetical protein